MVSEPPTPEDAARIQRVKFVLEMEQFRECLNRDSGLNSYDQYDGDTMAYSVALLRVMTHHRMDKRYLEALNLFTGPGLKRKTFRAEFEDALYSNHLEIAETGLFRSITSMIGFETVIVALDCDCSTFQQTDSPPKLELEMWLQNDWGDRRECSFESWEAARVYLRLQLEPHIGPGLEYDQHVQYRCIEFHSLKHQESLMKDNATIDTEASSLKSMSGLSQNA